jgi:hypothetical protein
MIDLSRFPFKSDIKKAQGLMMSSVVVKEYDEKCYFLYRDKQIKATFDWSSIHQNLSMHQ